MNETQRRRARTPTGLLLGIIAAVALLLPACMREYVALDEDAMHDLWVFTHPLCASPGLRLDTEDSVYVFERVDLYHHGMETDVGGEAVVLPGRQRRELSLSTLRVVRAWLPVEMELLLANSEEYIVEPGYWYFAMERGVPRALRITLAVGSTASIHTPLVFTYNDVRVMKIRTSISSPVFDYLLEEALY